jgi:hypothetical protein
LNKSEGTVEPEPDGKKSPPVAPEPDGAKILPVEPEPDGAKILPVEPEPDGAKILPVEPEPDGKVLPPVGPEPGGKKGSPVGPDPGGKMLLSLGAVPGGRMPGPVAPLPEGEIAPPVEPVPDGKTFPPGRDGLPGTPSAYGSCFSGIGGGAGITVPPIVLEFCSSGRACPDHCRQLVSLNPYVAGLTLHWPLGLQVGRIVYDWAKPAVRANKQSSAAPTILDAVIQCVDFFIR